MSADSPRVPASVEDRAADWLARRDAGFTPEASAEFERWLAADPRHLDAVTELEAAWSVLGRPRATGHAERVLADLAQRDHLRRYRRVRRFTWAAAGLAAAAALALAFWIPARLASVAHDRAAAITVVPRPERRTLADGSAVELNAGAEILVAFTAARREVKLLRGEAHFAVAKDPARPFVVAAGPVETRAVGTAFSVRFSEHDVRVLVTDGRVAVAHASPASSPATPAAAPLLVAAGSRVTVPLAESAGVAVPEPITPAETAAALLWRTQRVEFSGTTLAEAVVLFNRQNHVQLALADDSLGALRVSGIFWANDPAGFARLAAASFGLRVDSPGDLAVILRR